MDYSVPYDATDDKTIDYLKKVAMRTLRENKDKLDRITEYF